MTSFAPTDEFLDAGAAGSSFTVTTTASYNDEVVPEISENLIDPCEPNHDIIIESSPVGVSYELGSSSFEINIDASIN